jgi:hypothetical protein
VTDQAPPVILGDGIAGLAAAIRLAQLGAAPLVIGRRSNGATRDAGWVEVIHGRAHALLTALGLGDVVARAPRCAGSWSRWSMDAFVFRPTVLDPYGAGPIVDRSMLVAALLARAAGLGVRFMDARRWTGDPASVDIVATGRKGDCATGRRQIAMAVRCPGLQLGAVDTLIIDARSDGWWYGIESLGSSLVCFVTDLPGVRRAGSLRGCWQDAVDGCEWLPGERIP